MKRELNRILWRTGLCISYIILLVLDVGIVLLTDKTWADERNITETHIQGCWNRY